MKYSKTDIIQNIANFKFNDNRLLYSRGDSLRNRKLYLDKNDLNIESISGYYYFYEKILFNKWSTPEKSYILNIGDNTINEINNQRVQGFISNIIIYRSSNEDFYFYKNSSFEDLFSSFFYLEIIKDNYGITYNNQNISKVSFSNETLWNYPLSSLGKLPYKNENDEVDKILGIAHGNLWFYTKAGRLIALDIDSGIIVKKFSPHSEDETMLYEMCPGLGWIYFNSNDQNIYSMSSFFYQKINTKSLLIEDRLNIKNHLQLQKYSLRNALLQGKYFTFIACESDGGKYRFLGLFDIHKKQLVWEYELFSAKDDNELIAPEPLYMSGNKLYVKDFNSNLHIFERQD